MSAERIVTEEARLVILRELAGQRPNYSMTSSSLQDILRTMFLIVWPRERVEQEMVFLEKMGAVRLTPAGSVVIATLTDRGRMHLTHEDFVGGVKRTSLPLPVL